MESDQVLYKFFNMTEQYSPVYASHT